MTTSTRREHGTASVALPLLVWLATLAAVALLDLGAYLVAAARAQALADAAALAAVSADATGHPTGGPRAEAARVAAAGGGSLDACVCTPGRRPATVTVSVDVPGLVIPRLGAGRVAADAAAVLTSPDVPPATQP